MTTLDHPGRMLAGLAFLAGALGLTATTANAQTFADAVKAYARADEPTATAYTPDPAYSYNTGGGGITVTRKGTGWYRVDFEGLGALASGGHVQVSTYGSPASCYPVSWQNDLSGGDLWVLVDCRDASGAPADSPFTVMFVSSSGAAAPTMAYAWAGESTAAAYTPNPSYAYNGAGGAISASRSGTGVYTMRFAGMVVPGAGGHVQVSAYDFNVRCQPRAWSAIGGDLVVDVGCFGPAGEPVDSRYTVLFVTSDEATNDVGYAWANNAASASYTPNVFYSENRNGTITATRAATGNYAMTFRGLGGTAPGGTVLVSNYGINAIHCTVGEWGVDHDFSVNTGCFDSDGARTDSHYTVLVVWPDRPAFADGIFCNGFENSDHGDCDGEPDFSPTASSSRPAF